MTPGFPEFLPLPTKVIDENTATTLDEQGQPHRVYYNGPTDQLKAMIVGSLLLDPGNSPHPPHHHPEEEFMLVTEGTGEIFVDGTTYKVGPGAMMYCAGERLHAITNTGSTEMLFYYWKWLAK
ncbi:MAG TPA: cupin domain-containing protein [Bryobacteraceae bacterium]|nr:cupin domain-containing protein [Bryobacteraceae bacterium]